MSYSYPLAVQDVYGRNLVYNPATGTYQNLNADQIGTIFKTVGPLVVQYIVPFIKELIVALNASKTQAQNLLGFHVHQHYNAVPYNAIQWY